MTHHTLSISSIRDNLKLLKQNPRSPIKHVPNEDSNDEESPLGAMLDMNFSKSVDSMRTVGTINNPSRYRNEDHGENSKEEMNKCSDNIHEDDDHDDDSTANSTSSMNSTESEHSMTISALTSPSTSITYPAWLTESDEQVPETGMNPTPSGSMDSALVMNSNSGESLNLSTNSNETSFSTIEQYYIDNKLDLI